MSSTRFATSVALGVLGVLALVALSSVAIDYFGYFNLLRPVTGRKISIYYSERTSKLLLLHHYVPDNFDAILLGASSADSLDTQNFHSAKVYNASLLNARLPDLERVIDEIPTTARRLRYVLFGIRAQLLAPSDQNANSDPTRLPLTALASATLFGNYLMSAVHRLSSLSPPTFDENGDWQVPEEQPLGLVAARIALRAYKIRQRLAENQGPRSDPPAEASLGRLARKLHDRALIAIPFYSPMPDIVQLEAGDRYARAREHIAQGLRAPVPPISFVDGCLAPFSHDVTNFLDADHTSATGARRIVLALDRVLGELQRGAPHPSPCPEGPAPTPKETFDRDTVLSALPFLVSHARQQAESGRPDEAAETIRAARMLARDQAVEWESRLAELQETFNRQPASGAGAGNGEYNRGVRAQHGGDLAAALEHYRRALDLEQGRPQPNRIVLEKSHQNMAAVYAQQGNLELAIAHAQSSLAINPRNAAAHDSLGTLYQALGRFEEAAAQFRQASQLGYLPPDNSYVTVAEELFQEGSAPQAFQLLSAHGRAGLDKRRPDILERVRGALRAHREQIPQHELAAIEAELR